MCVCDIYWWSQTFDLCGSTSNPPDQATCLDSVLPWYSMLFPILRKIPLLLANCFYSIIIISFVCEQRLNHFHCCVHSRYSIVFLEWMNEWMNEMSHGKWPCVCVCVCVCVFEGWGERERWSCTWRQKDYCLSSKGRVDYSGLSDFLQEFLQGMPVWNSAGFPVPR